MLEVEKYKLSTYRAVETLRETKDSLVEIVESTFDGERYIRKTYHSDKRTVYNSIKNIENANIPKVHEVFFGEDTIIIEQYVEGKTLDELIESKYEFKRIEIQKIIESLLNAIFSLHTNKIIHRDIKPSNIVIKPNGEACLIDYSIARTYSATHSNDTEHFGTVGYAAPEQYGFAQSDFRTDIYALGITLQTIVSENNCSRIVRQAIDRCVEFDPHRRFQNIQEIRDYLHQGERKKKLKAGLGILFGITVIFLLSFLINKKPDGLPNIQNEPESIVSESNTDIQQSNNEEIEAADKSLLYEMTAERIVDVSGAEESIPCLQITPEEVCSATIEVGDSLSSINVTASLVGSTLEISINDLYTFYFTDDSGLSTASYPDGVTVAEILFYDMNNDGIADLLPVMSNAIRAEWPDGSVSLLKNYSLAWCIYNDNNAFICANEKMTAEMEPFRIYASMQGCLNADFPGYYKLENGKIVLH